MPDISTVQPLKSNLLACLGDSIPANSRLINSTSSKYAGHGFMTWVRVLSNGRIYHPQAPYTAGVANGANNMNFGIGGQNSSQIAARVGDVIAAKPAICIVEGSPNDGRDSLTAAQTIANYKSIYDALQAAGIVIIALPMTPLGNPYTNQINNLSQQNDWLFRQPSIRPNFYIADIRNVLGDPTNSYNWRSGLADSDLVHPNSRGCYYVGKTVAEIINSLPYTVLKPYSSQGDVYDATLNPSGNILSSPKMNGTGGTVTTTGTSTGISGTAANSWTLAAGTASGLGGATVAGSNGVDATNVATQTLTIGGTMSSGTTQGFDFTQASINPAKFSLGSTVEAMLPIAVTTPFSNILSMEWRLDITQTIGGVSSNWTASDLGPAVNPDLMPDENWSGLLRTPQYTIDPTAVISAVQVGLRIRFFDTTAGAVAGTIVLGPPTLRQLAN